MAPNVHTETRPGMTLAMWKDTHACSLALRTKHLPFLMDIGVKNAPYFREMVQTQPSFKSKMLGREFIKFFHRNCTGIWHTISSHSSLVSLKKHKKTHIQTEDFMELTSKKHPCFLQIKVLLQIQPRGLGMGGRGRGECYMYCYM